MAGQRIAAAPAAEEREWAAPCSTTGRSRSRNRRSYRTAPLAGTADRDRVSSTPSRAAAAAAAGRRGMVQLRVAVRPRSIPGARAAPAAVETAATAVTTAARPEAAADSVG